MGHAFGGVADDNTLIQIIAKDWAYAEGLNGLQVHHDLRRTFEGIFGFHLGGCRSLVDEGIVKQLGMGVRIERTDVISGT